MNEEKPFALGLFRRRQCTVPTWRGWLLILVCALGLATATVLNAYPFLALTDPAPGSGGILVAEGWGPDFFLASVKSEFQKGSYSDLFTTGGPIEKGAKFCHYKTFAEYSEASLVEMGLDSSHLHAVPARSVLRDRTYSSAVALKQWLHEHGMKPERITLMSVGPHARRSRLLFQKAFGDDVKIGIIAVEDDTPEIERHHWWMTSEGFRSVTGEMIAYLYARVIFHAPSS
jgi:hypothetical protein